MSDARICCPEHLLVLLPAHPTTAFADDMSGGYYGFEPSTTGVVALEYCNCDTQATGQTFNEFLADFAEDFLPANP
jgi:hypothetical protein